MKLAIIVILFILHNVRSSETNEDREPYAYDESSFEEYVPSETHFIMFYAPWCGHCRALRPAWTLLEEHYNEKQTGTIKVAKVDCTTQRSLCSENGVTGYPTLKLFIPGKEAIRHRGARDFQSLKNFVTQSLEGGGDDIQKEESDKAKAVEGLHDLTTDNFDDHIALGHHFVKFYAPWCGHCKRLEPTWKQLATELKDRTDVSVGRVDCTVNSKLCESHKVRGYPTLLWFENGEKLEQYQGGRSLENLLEMVTKMTGKKHVITKDEEKEVVDLPVVETAKAVQEPTVIEGLTELTEESFDSEIAGSGIFINFFAPWCGVCKRLEPTWNELAGLYKDNDNIKIARIDCTQHSSVCKSQEIRGYPTLKFFRNGEEEKGGPGGRDLENLKAFIQSKLEDNDEEDEDNEEGVKELTGKTFGKVIEYGITFVKFYAPWCGHCKRLAPTWDELGLEDFSDASAPVTIAKVDCTKFDSICTNNRVRGYPTLILFVDGEQAATYGGHAARTKEAFKKFVLETSDRYLSENHPRDEL